MVLVAKSYQDLSTIGNPYMKGNKQYIKVITKNGNEKEVRVYTEKEYKKMYPDIAVPTEATNTHSYEPQKDVLGFRNGPITIFVGDIVKNEEYFNSYKDARFHKLWGWYLVNGTDISNVVLPENVYPAFLSWEQVGQEDGYLKSDDEIIKIVRQTAREMRKIVGK